MFLCVCVWLHHSGSRWLQWWDRWSCNRMKVTLTLSGWLTHSQMIGSSWGAAVVAMPPPPPIYDSFPYFLHCLINVLTSFLPLSVRRSVPCLSVFHFPPPRISRGSFRAPRWGSAVSALLDPPARPLAPIAPVMAVCSTLSHLTGNLHSSITAWRQIYMLNRC